MRCHHLIFNTCNIQETIDSFACGLYISSFFLTNMNSFCWQKCWLRLKLFLLLDLLSTFRSVHTLIFTYVPCIVIGLHVFWGTGKFFKGKGKCYFCDWPFVLLFCWFYLICLVTQILTCENQSTWRLKIQLRMIVAALLKTKCNDCFV